MSRSAPVVRFRHHPGWAVGGFVVALSLTTLIPASGWFALLVLPPLVWTGWAWRAGTDLDASGVRVRALLTSHAVPWSRVDHLAALTPDRVVAKLADGAVLPLTAVRAADLGRLAEWAPAAGPPDTAPATGAKPAKWF